MLALIDGDIVVHRVAWTTENDDFGIAKFRADDMLDGILLDTGAEEFSIFLSDRAENNFRYKIYPQYKANRSSLPKPRHLESLKEYLIERWGAKIAHEQEADDALGIAQVKQSQDNYVMSCVNETHEHKFSVVCSIDKDLLQIPGNHYNFVKKEWTTITEEQGLQHFYKQILIGDISDNIGGCPGIGEVKASKALRGLGGDVRALSKAVFRLYVEKTGAKSVESKKDIFSYIEKIGQVLKIRQIEDEPLWLFPLENQMEEFQSQSTQAKQEASGQSTEPISATQPGSCTVGEKMEERSKESSLSLT